MRATTPGESPRPTAPVNWPDRAVLPASEMAFAGGLVCARPEETGPPMRTTNAVRVTAVFCSLIIANAPSLSPEIHRDGIKIAKSISRRRSFRIAGGTLMHLIDNPKRGGILLWPPLWQGVDVSAISR